MTTHEVSQTPWPRWVDAPAHWRDDGQVRLAVGDLAEVVQHGNWPCTPIVLMQDGTFPVEAWRRVVHDDRVELFAGDAAGARHAVFALLHDQGVRWFAPGEPAMVPAKPATLANRQACPDLAYRGLHICGAKDHYDPAVVLWMARLGMNRKLVHHHELAACDAPLARHGLVPDSTVHSYEWWIPDRLWHADRPEWFALVGGRRIPQSQGGQLCLSHQGMRQQFVHHMRQMLDQHPAMRVVGVCPNDGYGWCECPSCQAMDQQAHPHHPGVHGRVARFVEYLCEQLAQSHPHVQVGHYCYSNFRDFPQYLTRPLPNLTISCTLSRCFGHALDDPACPTNAALARHLQAIRPRVGQVYTYEYYMHRWADLPAATWRMVAADMRALKRWGVQGFLTEVLPANDPGWDSFALPIALAAAAMWDVNLDVDAFLADWCNKRYGQAGPAMRRYLDALEQGRTRAGQCTRHHPADLPSLLPPDCLRQARLALDDALALAGDAPHAQAVRKESGRLEHWRWILQQREELASATVSPVARPMAELSLTHPPMEPGLPLIDSTYLVPPRQATGQVWVFADEASVGLLIECVEPRMDQLVEHPGDSLGAVYSSDGVEVFFATSPEAKTCGHILVNTAGASIGSFCEGQRWNWAWQGRWKASALKLADRWRVAIIQPRGPLRDEHGENAPADGDAERQAVIEPVCFSVARNRHAGGGWEISGTPTGSPSFDPAAYWMVPAR